MKLILESQCTDRYTYSCTGARKRVDMTNEANVFISECGCGGLGCCMHGTYKGKTNENGIAFLNKIMNKTSSVGKAKNSLKDELATYNTDETYYLFQIASEGLI